MLDENVVLGSILLAAMISKVSHGGWHVKKISSFVRGTGATVKEQFFTLRSPRKLEKEKTRRQLLAVATVIVLALSFSDLVLAQADPFLGTWKLNVKRSKFVPGPPRKSETRIVVSTPTGMNVSSARVDGDGSTQEFEYTSNLDGKSYPIVGRGPYGANTIAATLTAPKTIQSTLNKDSKVLATGTSVVSEDGRVLTITTKGMDASGKSFNSVAVYDKQ